MTLNELNVVKKSKRQEYQEYLKKQACGMYMIQMTEAEWSFQIKVMRRT